MNEPQERLDKLSKILGDRLIELWRTRAREMYDKQNWIATKMSRDEFVYHYMVVRYAECKDQMVGLRKYV